MPEVLHGLGDIGVAKVFREGESEHFTQTNCHVGITGEVKVDLEGVADDAQPGLGRVKSRGWGGKDAVCYFRQSVGDEYFFGKADDEALYAFAESREAYAPFFQLFVDIAVAYDRACYELRETGDIAAEVNEFTGGWYSSPVNIDDIAQALEGEKADAYRQGDMLPVAWFCLQNIQNEEIGVFEVCQETEVKEQRSNEKDKRCFRLRCFFFCLLDGTSQKIIDQYRD